MIAITGGTGFVGRRLTEKLIRRQQKVVLLSRRRDETYCHRADPGHIEYRYWNASSGELPPLEGVERVIHLAAYIPKNYSDASEAQACVQTNVMGTLALMLSAEKFGCAHVTIMSSGNVYKQQAASASELSPTYPDQRSSFYLGSKLLGEIWGSHFATRGLKALVLRPSAIYGPGMKGGIVRLLIDRLRAGEEVVLQNQGRYSSDLVYVDDVVNACLMGSTHQSTGILNVGAGEATTIAQLARVVSKTLGVSFEELISLQPANSSDEGFSALDVGTLIATLGLYPTKLDDGIAKMIAEES